MAISLDLFRILYQDTLKYWIDKKKLFQFYNDNWFGIICINFSKKELIPTEDRGAYLIIGSLMKVVLLNILKIEHKYVESRIMRLLQAEDSPYERLIMRVPGFGKSLQRHIIHL